jgi:HSP20 family molecular chaperone IbpA
LPGVKKEEISIDADADQLVIHGHHKGKEGFESATSRVRERNIGRYVYILYTHIIYRFRKIILLPAGVDTNNVQAHYEDGLLEVRVP